MHRGTIEATERARVSASDFNERCDQRRFIRYEIVNIFTAAGELARCPTSNDPVAIVRRPRRSLRRALPWYLALAAWAALVGSGAAIPLVDDGSQMTIVAADSVLGGALVCFVGWRVSAWATAILTRMARAPDDRRARYRSL